MTLPTSRPLNIIMEEDELSSRSPSPSPSSIKATRRHARITGNDLADLDTAFPSNRRPVYPSPSPASSSDSLKLSFTELLKFPYPPTSYLSSSPHSSGMPVTPDSDIDFTLPSPCFRPTNPVMLNFSRDSIDSDADSDSEWYHNEFSKLIETPCPSPQLLPPSRPESIYISTDDYGPTIRRRSISSDMIFPCRNSKPRNGILPSYRPLPPLPQHAPPRLVNISRPPPRSTLPSDCVVDLFVDNDERDADSDSSSLFSFSMYDIDLGDHRLAGYPSPNSQSLPQSPRIKSTLSFDMELGQEIEVDLDDARFELDYQLPLPFSIPATPLDLEFDMTKSFERLGESDRARAFNKSKPPYTPAAKEFPRTPVKTASRSAHNTTDPSISPFIFSPTSPLSPSFNRDERVLKSKWSSSTIGSLREEHARTKNKIGRAASSKLKLYFGGGSSTPPKTTSKHSKTPSSSLKSLSQPSSPLSSTPPRKIKAYSPSLSPSPLPLRWPSTRGHKRKPSVQQTQQPSHTHRPNNSPDVLIIGYGQGANRLKRRGSSATMSSEGAMSELSASSSSTNGLKRKPIPIEMFLRNATCPPRYLNPI